jgi:sortase (surface protein transpeptidase)
MDEECLTLVTCHPYGSLRNRLIVIARPTEREVGLDPPEE